MNKLKLGLTRGRDLALTILPVLTLLITASVGPAQTFDPAVQFSVTNNPNGVWSYGYSTTFRSPFIFYPYSGINLMSGSELDVWAPALGFPALYHNPTSNRYINGTQSIGPGEFGFHPGPSGEYSVLRFSAASSGHYLIQGYFFGQDPHPTSTDVHLLVNEVSAFDGYVNAFGTGPNFLFLETLNAADLVDFTVGYGGNGYGFDSTGLSASLTLIPPPVVAMLTPAAGASQWACAPFTVAATASSPGQSLTNLVIVLDGTNQLGGRSYSLNAAVTGITSRVTMKTDVLGLHSLTATATDVFGAITSSTNTFNIVAPPLHVLVADAFITNGQCLLCMSGQVGHAYSILATTNFQTWTNIGTMQNVNGLLEFPDPMTTNFQHQFYRALQQ
jgi:hypothetical protein